MVLVAVLAASDISTSESPKQATMNGSIISPPPPAVALRLALFLFVFCEVLWGDAFFPQSISTMGHQLLERPRLLLAIAVHLTPDGANETMSYLRRSISELRSRYLLRYDVHAFIDTNNASLANAIQIFATETAADRGGHGRERKLPVLPLSVREWSLEELGNDPFQLTGVHRRLMEREAGAYEFFAYLEDNMLMPLEAIEYFVKERQEL